MAIVDWYPSFLEEFSALVGATWSLPAKQVKTTNQSVVKNFVDSVSKAAAEVPGYDPLPWAIIQPGIEHPTNGAYGVQNDAYNMEMSVWLVAKTEDLGTVQNQTSIRSMLFQLFANVAEGTFPEGFVSPISSTQQCVTFEAMVDPNMDSSEQEPLNQAMRGKSQISISTGCISWSPGLLVGSFVSQEYP